MLLAPTKSILLMLLAYFAGSIPFGYIVSMTYGGIDIREHGSGNVGMTNVFRTLGPLPGAITLLLDALKGYLVVLLSLRWIPPIEFGYNYPMWGVIICLISFLTVLGHSFPIWLGFKGGKSVAVSLGILAALMSWWIAVPIAIFLIVSGISRYVSLGSMISAISVPVLFIIYHTFPHAGYSSDSIFIAFACILAVLVLIRHASNIKRLLKGTENKFGIKIEKPVSIEKIELPGQNPDDEI